MAQSIIDISIEQGIEQGIEKTKREDIIKLLEIKFETLPETIIKKINGIQDHSRLNSLFEKAATIDTLDDFDE